MKILCVQLPHFSLRCELLRRPGLRGAAVIARSSGSQKLVLDYSPELEGLQPDMPLQQVLSLHGEVDIINADMPYYRSVFSEILDALETRSPLVEGTESGEVYIGLDGMQLIYPDDDALVKAVREVIPGVFEARYGIAQGKYPSYLAALYSPPGGYKALSGNIRAFLKDIPCDVLPVSIKIKNRLHEFGLHTLGRIASLQPGPLQAQFGSEGRRMWELATGYDGMPLCPRLTEEMIEERMELASVTASLDVIIMALESMLSKAFVNLASRGMGINRIIVWTRTWISEYRERIIQFKEPAMDIMSVVSRIKQVMENSPQPGPVEQVGIKITGLSHRQGRQKNLFPEVRAQDNFMNDVRQLEFRLGGPQLFQFKEVEPWSRIPERRHALIPLNR